MKNFLKKMLIAYLCSEGDLSFLRLIDLKEFKSALHSALQREKLKFFKNALKRGG